MPIAPYIPASLPYAAACKVDNRKARNMKQPLASFTFFACVVMVAILAMSAKEMKLQNSNRQAEHPIHGPVEGYGGGLFLFESYLQSHDLWFTDTPGLMLDGGVMMNASILPYLAATGGGSLTGPGGKSRG